MRNKQFNLNFWNSNHVDLKHVSKKTNYYSIIRAASSIRWIMSTKEDMDAILEQIETMDTIITYYLKI